jgi:ATP-dependent RNA helicase RhlE
VFTRTKHGADRLARRLKAERLAAAPLHGDRSQSQRERALRDFKNGRIRVLVATDIASRGIDVDDVTHVINFDVPRAPEDYVHRIGRTGRMDAIGEAITLVSPDEAKEFAAIEAMIGKPVTRRTLPGFEHRPAAKSASRESRRGGGDREAARERSAHRGSVAGRHADRSVVHSHADRSATPAAVPASGAADGGATHGRRPRSGANDRRSRRRM